MTSEELAATSSNADSRVLVTDLNELIALCRNGEKGYTMACSRVEAPLLRSLLTSYAEQRAAFAESLQVEVGRLGATAETTGDLAGSFHRLWLRLRYLARPRDATVIAECLVGDSAAVEVYEEVRQKPLPQPLQVIVEQQYEAVRAARDRLSALHRGRLGARNGWM